MRRTPLSPLCVAFQNRSRPIPFGLIAPIPVMTTRRMRIVLPLYIGQYRLIRMDAATERKPASTISALLAGLQGGMVGICWMLGWLGISAIWQRRSFWTAENLMASAFYGGSAIRGGFTAHTPSGVALYL